MTTKPSENIFYAPVERDLSGKISDDEAAQESSTALAWFTLAFIVLMATVSFGVWLYCKKKGYL